VTVSIHPNTQYTEEKDLKQPIYCTECPPGFTYLSTTTGGCYKVINVNLNWDDAGVRCQSLDEQAHLLVINDAAEQSAVAAMLDAIDR